MTHTTIHQIRPSTQHTWSCSIITHYCIIYARMTTRTSIHNSQSKVGGCCLVIPLHVHLYNPTKSKVCAGLVRNHLHLLPHKLSKHSNERSYAINKKLLQLAMLKLHLNLIEFVYISQFYIILMLTTLTHFSLCILQLSNL